MIALLFAAIVQQGISARVVILEVTVDKKRIGEVSFFKQIVPGKGVERITTYKVEEEGEEQYVIRERRFFDLTGNPVSIERTYTEDGEVLTVSVKFHDNIADVTYGKGDDKQTSSVALIEDDASTKAESELWFVMKKPKRSDRVEFWEFDIDSSNWVKRVVTYHGLTDLKVGEEFLRAHRITVGEHINIYVDEFGMPYKLSDKSVRGGLVLTRTLPADGVGS